MKIVILPVGPLEANCCLAYDEETGKGIILDPGAQAEKIRNAVEKAGMQPEAILLTHGHFDHVMAAEALRDLYEIPVVIGEKEEELLADPEKNLSMPYMRMSVQLYADQTVCDGEVLPYLGGLKVLEVPGHTPGSVCYYSESGGILFSGDALFQESIGRTDTYAEQNTLIRNIRMKLLVLPEETQVVPGHGPVTGIGHEKNYNMFLR